MLKRIDSPAVDYDAPPSEPTGFDLREALNFVWRQWKFIGGVALLALLVGALYLSRQTPLYTATVELLLEPANSRPAGQVDAATNDVLDVSVIESQIAVIKSTSLLRRVVDKERLVNDPEFGVGPAVSGGDLIASIRSFFSRSEAPPPSANDAAKPPASDPTQDALATVDNLKGAIDVKRVGESLVLDINFTSADPAKAARLANAVADGYVVDKLDARFEAAKRASAWLSDRLVELRQQLRDSEEAVARFRSDNNLVVSTPQGGASLNQEQLGQLNGRLVAARAETAEKKTRLDLLQRVQSAGGVISDLPDIANAGAIPDLRRQENDLRRQEADLLSRYNDRHPQVVNIRAQIADLRRAIAGEAGRLAADVKHEYELAQARQAAVEKALNEVTGQTDLDASKAITLRELDRNAAVNKTLFEDFLQKSKITAEQSTFEARDARVISPAMPPGGPSAPNSNRIMMTAILLGLVAGVGGAYLIEMLNAGFTTPRQVEDMLNLPLLTSISRMEARDLASDGGVLTLPDYPIAKPLSRFSEAVRSLRSAVQMSDVDHPPKVLMVTSAAPNEGKTTLALTIAASAAQSGLKTLVVDADLRHPSASRYFKPENQERDAGLVDYLVGDAEIADVILRNDKLRLWVLPAGTKTQNPGDLLGSDRFKALIGALRERFDLVVLDTPPLGPVADAYIVANVADKVVFVVRWAKTARELVQQAVERLAGHRKVAGLVFNHVIDAQAQKYGRYAYSYYYGGRYYRKYYDE